MSLPESMIKASNLTPVQIESLVSYQSVRSHEMTLRQAASLRSTTKTKAGKLKIGSYYRTVSQGRENVKSSIMTVVVSLWLGFVESEDLRRLFDQAGRGLPELADEEKERIAALVEALVTQIVM